MTTLDQSDVSALLHAFRAGDAVDLIGDLVRLVLQEIVEDETAAAIGAGRYERAEGRLTERSGDRAKTIATKAGDLEQEVKRRCRVVGIFPTEAVLVRLAGAVLLDTHEEWLAAERRYFSETSMASLYPERDDADAITGELEGASAD